MSKNSNQAGYQSCIKVFGIPILPPLISEERRKELNHDKQRAIEIEKKLKGKRSSIDSGVMTGSYIEHLKSFETQQKDDSFIQQSIHDSIFKGDIQNGVSISTNEVVDYAVNDSYLKTALEDPEFREFFSSTAEKIFKDNKIQNIFNVPSEGGLGTSKVKHVSSEDSEIKSSQVVSESSSFLFSPGLVDFSISTQVPSLATNNLTLRCSETTVDDGNVPDEKQMEEPTSPPPPRIRRNSYTLDSPSPVLLEHMAKEIASGTKESEKWQSLSDKKEKPKGPGFKTFSGKSQRKHWNKKNCLPSSILRVDNTRNKFTLARSNTFVKPTRKVDESNYSLPCSSRTSPFHFNSFTRSVDCINTMGTNYLNELQKDEKVSYRISPESENKLRISEIPMKNNSSHLPSDSETYIVHKDSEIQSATTTDVSPTSMINNPSSEQSNSSIETISPPHIEFNDSASQMSVKTHSIYAPESSVSSRNVENRNELNNTNHSEDFDDIASLCSSMSISTFLPKNGASRPSTAESLCQASIRQLKMKHENELRKLLEKQRKEEEMVSQLLSVSGSLSSRTTISIGDPFETKSEILFVDKGRDSCSRELFPMNKQSPDKIPTYQKDDYSQKEMEAATKITAHVKGYLTRRLLRTEKVQLLMELIKESLTCAFSLQLEPHLKPTDLELHARLAHQLNTALKELQSIVTAPAAARMAIIAADRERLRRPASRPSSTISAATRKSMLRRQQSLNSAEKKPRESRPRTKSFSVSGSIGSVASGSQLRSDSLSSSLSTSSSRKPWR